MYFLYINYHHNQYKSIVLKSIIISRKF